MAICEHANLGILAASSLRSLCLQVCTRAIVLRQKPFAQQMMCCGACAGASLVSLAEPVVQQLLGHMDTTHLRQQLRLHLPLMTHGTASAAASSHLRLAWSSCNGFLQWLQDEASRVSDPLWYATSLTQRA